MDLFDMYFFDFAENRHYLSQFFSEVCTNKIKMERYW